MKRKVFFAAITLVALACDQQRSVVAPDGPATSRAFAAGPADGNGNKQVITFNVSNPVTCPNGTTLIRNARGWAQVKTFGGVGNRNVELQVFHNVLTFTNAAGDTFTFHDVGPDHYYTADDQFFVSITGRATGSGVIGHVVINLTTGETEFVAGQAFEPVRLQACAALT